MARLKPLPGGPEAPAPGGRGALAIRPLGPERSPELLEVARWRHEAFLAPNYTLEDSVRQLEAVAADAEEVALVGWLGQTPVGVCMLVRDELKPRHALSPWLASMYVVPAHRRLGIGRTLVRAVEDHARGLGRCRLWLYTGGAIGFYERCGWWVVERFDWDGEAMALMEQAL